jgi:uncharacterized membrane protein (UPF0182 family)
MRKNVAWLIIALVLFLLLGGLAFTVDLYFDWLWFQELAKTTLFTTVLYAKSALASATLLTAFLFLFLNLWHANRAPGLIQIGIPTPTGQITAYTVTPDKVNRLSGLLSLVIGLFLAARNANAWEVVWRWLNRIEFGSADPIFGRDISFYFFTLPVMEELVRVGFLLLLLTGAGVIALYYFKGTLRLKGVRGFGKHRLVPGHLSFLVGLLFVLLAVDAYLDRFQILYANHGPMYGATYADLNARLPLLTLLAACAVLAAIVWLVNAFASCNRAALLSGGLYVVVLIIGNLYPTLLQKFVVAPDELGREAPQIEHNIQATLKAYGLEKVQDRNLTGDQALTPGDIRENAATIRSIRLWDHEPLLDAFSQIQEIRTYYKFHSVDNDRYLVDGAPQQMMLSSRELNAASLPERNWINEHLSYTHGYGLTLGPVNRVTTEGLPVLLVQDIPPRTLNPIFKIERPEIYFGEQTTQYVVVRSGAKEFDYPSGEANVYTTYEGKGGVPIHSFFRKLLFAVYFRDLNVVLSPLLKAESRVLYFREIKTRLGRIAPFLVLDRDPYLVISEGKLFWIQDAYTVSDRYPYATPTRGMGNYIRNSVKMVLDAYNGSVDLFVSDPDDPLIRVYQRIFPGVFRPLSEIPKDLRSHLRYPEDIFQIQTYVYSVYHMNKPQVFYNKEDLWEIPVIASSGGEKPMLPYYTIMRLPQEVDEEFILMLPFTPGRKDNLSAWIVGRSDGEHYGQLVVYRFPKQKLVYGPKQIVARINQDAEISRQVSLWDQRGSQVMQGTLLVIPIKEALLYVRPLYLRAETGKIPELKRVIVAYENKIAMEETLEASIGRIFQGQIAPAAAISTPPTAPATESLPVIPASDRLREARDVYNRAVQAQREGDWARYGEELKKLGAILEELNKASRQVPAIPIK